MQSNDSKLKKYVDNSYFNVVNYNNGYAHINASPNDLTSSTIINKKLTQAQTFRHPKLRNICSFIVPKQPTESPRKPIQISYDPS